MLHSLLPAVLALAAASSPAAVLEPGLEAPLLTALRPAAGELPDDWALLGIHIPKDRVEASYGPGSDGETGCEDAPLCVTLGLPGDGDARVGHFTLSASSDSPALLRGIRDRLPAAVPRDPWKRLGAPPERAPPTATVSATEAAFRALLSSDAELLGRLEHVTLTAQTATLRLRADTGGPLVAVLVDRPHHLSNPDETTANFHVRFRGGLVGPEDLQTRVLAALRTGDDGTIRLAPAPTFEDHTGTWLHDVLWWLAALVLLLLVLSLPAVGRATLETLGRDPLTWAILAAGIALRLALPGRMIELGIGVMLTDYAQYLIMPRYGPAVPALHHGLFALFGVDHDVIITAHRLLGCLMLPVACAGGLHLLAGLRERAPALAPLWAFGLAFTPMLVRAEATESNLQPALFAFWVGLLGWSACKGWARHAAALGGLGFAMLARPELVLIAPAAWLLLCRPWSAGKVVIAGLALLAPWQLAHLAQRTIWEVSAESLEFGEAFFGDHLWTHLAQTALIEPMIAPLLTTVLALVGLVRLRTDRRVIWALAAGGLLWIAAYAVDLSSASAPRLHVAGLQAWTLIAAATLARFVVGHRAARVVLGGLWLASAAYTVPWLWAPTNEDTEGSLVTRLEATVAAEPDAPLVAVLQHVDVRDGEGHGTHRYFPSYRFAPDSVISLGQLARALAVGQREVLYYQGVNCYAELDRDERGGSGLVPACRAVHDQLTLEPVWTEDVTNHGNPRFQELGYYGPEPTLQVGVWRVRGP